MAKPLWTMNIHIKNEGQKCKTMSCLGGGGGMEREGEYGCCTLYTSLKRAMKAVKSF
jgi:hypothetical protein